MHIKSYYRATFPTAASPSKTSFTLLLGFGGALLSAIVSIVVLYLVLCLWFFFTGAVCRMQLSLSSGCERDIVLVGCCCIIE